MTVAGAVAFYLSAPGADGEPARRADGGDGRELRPLLDPALAIFAVWRAAKRRRERQPGRRCPTSAADTVPVLG